MKKIGQIAERLERFSVLDKRCHEQKNDWGDILEGGGLCETLTSVDFPWCLSWMRRAVPHLQAWQGQLPFYDIGGENISAQIEALEQLLKELEQ